MSVVNVYESDKPEGAMQVLGDSLSRNLPLRSTAWICAEQRSVRASWPADPQFSPELLELALHVGRPEVFPLGSEFPDDRVRFPEADVLLLPLGARENLCGTAVLLADAGAFGEDLEAWTSLTTALHRVVRGHRDRCRAEEERVSLRQRAEESEALYTLGLAITRTLDPAEVLTLVARFARALLGASSVVVNTVDNGKLNASAAVGQRNANDERECHFARRVIDAGRPITVGGGENDVRVNDSPYHHGEGLQAGLGVPLTLFGNCFGALVVGYRRPYTVTPRDVRLALTLAGHAAVAISNAQLYRQVGIHAAALERAYEQLQEATQAKERFFNAISHDLRTPVGAIKGYNDLLLEGLAGELPDKAQMYLGNSRRAAETLLALVNDILDFAKLEAGKVELDLQHCTVADLLENALAAVRPQADAKALHLHVALGADLPPLHTDPRRVGQILVNLLSNAIKFTPDGKRIQLRATVHGASQLVVEVADSGPGIPAEDCDRIFQEFEQVRGTQGGTGLGLPISRKLARLLGGDLQVRSESGAGSTFVLHLPAATPNAV